MNTFDINCQICYHKYDIELRIPRILSNCGHTICSVCITKILEEAGQTRLVTCPFDKKKFFVRNEDLENFNRNFALLQIIEDQKNHARDFCQIHEKKKDHFCVSEGLALCADCGNDPVHKDHLIFVTADIKQKVDEKAKLLKNLVQEVVENGIINLKKILIAGNDKEKTLLAMIDKKFQDYINLVIARKNEVKTEISKYLNQLMTEAEDKYTVFMAEDQKSKKLFNWKEQAEKMLERWNAPESYGIVPEMLEEKIDLVREDIKNWTTHIQEKFNLQEFYTKVECLVVIYNEEDLAPFVKEFCEIKYTGHVEKVVMPNLEEASQTDISIVEKKHDATEYAIFTLQEYLAEQPAQQNDRRTQNASLALDKLFRKNKVKSERKTDSFEKTLILTEDYSKKSFSFGSYFSKPNLRALQDLSSLNIVCEKLDHSLIKGFSDSLNSLTGLKNLKIQFSNAFSLYDFSNKAIVDSFAPSLGRLVSLENLEIDLRECSRLKDDGVAALGKAFEKLPRVSTLVMHLPKDGAYTDKGLLELGQGISALKSIKDIKIRVPENSNVACNKVAAFCGHIVKPKGLEVLHIDISKFKSLSEADITVIGESMKNMSGIREFWIKLSPKDGVTLKQLSYLVSKMSSVNTLGVEIYGMKQIAGDEMVGLAEAFSKLLELNKLHLFCEKWRISMDKNFPKIGEAIARIKKLAALSIHLKGCATLSKNSVQDFFLHVKEIVNLVELVFRNDKMDEAAAVQLCYFLATLRKLRRLCVDFSGCSDIKDSTLQILSNSLEQMGMLSHLELTFKDCLSVSDKGVLQLLEIVANKDEMNLISLGLLDCNVTDKTLMALSRMVSQFAKLNRVKIDFSGSNGVTDEGIKKISSVIANEAEKLYMACLMFERCGKVGSEGRKALEDLKQFLEGKGGLCVKVLYDGNENFLPRPARTQTKSFVSN